MQRMPRSKSLARVRRLQAAAIPYRIRSGRIEIALIKTRRRKTWGVPKGFVESGERPPQSAAREALEEAGLAGRVRRRPVGSYVYEKASRSIRVYVFLLRVTQAHRNWPEDERRMRTWQRLEKAIRRVDHPALRRLLERLPGQLAG